MLIQTLFLTLSLLSLHFQTLIAFNLSNIYLSSQLNLNQSPSPPQSSNNYLKDVLKAIRVKQSWDSDDVIRVSDVDVGSAKIGRSERFKFRVKVGKSDMVFKFAEEVDDSWRKLGESGEFRSLVDGVREKSAVKTLKLDGPFELRVRGGDELSLTLPKNITHTGLKRVLVGEGIAVEVTGARDVSLFHTYPFVLPVNRSLVLNEDRSHYWPFRDSFCTLLPHLHISGPASLIAYKTRNSNAYIETKYLSQDMIELLSEKCYTRHLYKKRSFPIGSLNPRLALLDKLMKNFIDESILQNGVLGFLKGDITASTLILFELEIERDVGEKDNLAGTLTEWRTKPRTQRVHFDVVARVEDDRLKPLVVKKFRPFISSDSAAWSTLMSNLSFTKFPSLLVPPEALTLDVKW